MSTKDTLIKAKEILIERGVTRDGWYVDDDGCKVCAIGALMLATGGEVQGATEIGLRPRVSGYDRRNMSEAEMLLSKAAWGLYNYENVAMFNDSSQNDEEVVALFDRAIEIAE